MLAWRWQAYLHQPKFLKCGRLECSLGALVDGMFDGQELLVLTMCWFVVYGSRQY